MNTASLLIAGSLLLILLFVVTWRLSVKKDNFSFVDITWALSFTPVAIFYAAANPAHGWLPRKLIVAALVSAWSLRLGIYLWHRVASHHPQEDARYGVLRKRWQDQDLGRPFLFFFLGQALLVWLLMLPVFFICRNESPVFHPLEIAGAALWVVGLTGEAISDRQLQKFKSNHASQPNSLCNEGLWKLSRHPNYFFQSLLWWGLFLVALPVDWGWVAVLAPLAMLLFLTRITGIPLTEELAVQKRGDLYRDYQRSTSAFLPLPPRR